MIKDFEGSLREKFGMVFRVVSEKSDFDFPVLFQVREIREDGTVIGAMYPDDGKDFYMEITEVVPLDDQWLVTTPTERWSFRPLPEKVRQEFAAYMQSCGFKV